VLPQSWGSTVTHGGRILAAVCCVCAMASLAAHRAGADVDATGAWLTLIPDLTERVVYTWVQSGSTLSTAQGFAGTIDPTTGSFSMSRPPLPPCMPDTFSGTVALDGLSFTGTLVVHLTPFSCLSGASLSVLGSRCGSGTIEPGEQCDDGNSQDGDGCNSLCQIEPCFLCTGQPSLCALGPAGTPCDDGNPDGNPCTAGACDASGACTGTRPADCDDGVACTNDTCDVVLGCVHTANCDDGRACTIDSCDAVLGCVHTPDVRSCRSAPISTLRVVAAGATDTLTWKWRNGQSTNQGEFADPRTIAAYSFCLFAGAPAAIVAEADVPPDAQKWAALGSTGFEFKDTSGAADGIRRILLRGSDANQTKIVLEGQGAGLSLTAPPLNVPLTAQVTNAQTNVCWSATYGASDVRRNRGGRLKAKLAAP
jgi:cysteine-rich repeat protein